jgi:uncharacterized protein YjdB
VFGCGDGFVGPLHLSVDPPRLLLTLGESANVAVIVVDAEGTTVPNRAITFTSNNEDIVTVTLDGQVLATGFGSTQIEFASKDLAGFVPVRVSPVDLTVQPTSVVIGVGKSSSASATVYHPDGRVISIPLTWWSEDPECARVGSQGQMTGVAPGLTTVFVEAEGVPPKSVAVRVGPQAEGSWDGLLQDIWFPMTLRERTAGTIGGSVNLGFVAPTVSGTITAMAVSMVWTAEGYEPAYFTGEFVSDDQILGTLTGSGFEGDSVQFQRH